MKHHGCRLVAACLLLLAGCLPGVQVRRNPTAHDRGIRYYRPKPYLLLTPVESQVRVHGRELTEVTTTGEYVQLQLDYLPDFSEEYAITITPGLGTAEVGITLEDGWNLTQISQDLDSQTDENVEAISDLVDAVASVGQESGLAPRSQDDEVPQRWVVRASNVPLGYYEAVLHRDPCGTKRLCGWRYVGFIPVGVGLSPPISEPRGGDPCHPLCGLVFDQGVMTFKPLADLHADPSRVPVSSGFSRQASREVSREFRGPEEGPTGLPIRPAAVSVPAASADMAISLTAG
ncbi:MAG: hypothetical protein AAGF97_16115 [Planctomycetota bacterium]